MAPAQLILAVRPVARSVRWAPLVAGAAGGVLLVLLARPRQVGPAATLGALRLAAFLLAAGAAFALDDQAASTVAPAPLPLAARRGLRLAVVLLPAGVGWALIVSLAVLVAPGAQAAPPLGALTVEAAAMVAVSLAAAAVAGPRAPDGLGGAAGGPVLMLLVLASLFTQPHWPDVVTLLPFGPSDPQWSPAHARWGALGVAAVTAIGVTSLDPARRSRRWAAIVPNPLTRRRP